MPWVKKDDCLGCGICVSKCPVGVISMIDCLAEIDNAKCIHCGICHSVCPQHAIRHDVERIPQEVDENVKWVVSLLRHYETDKEKKAYLDRMVRHFRKESMVAQKTIERIESMLAGGEGLAP